MQHGSGRHMMTGKASSQQSYYMDYGFQFATTLPLILCRSEARVAAVAVTISMVRVAEVEKITSSPRQVTHLPEASISANALALEGRPTDRGARVQPMGRDAAKRPRENRQSAGSWDASSGVEGSDPK